MYFHCVCVGISNPLNENLRKKKTQKYFFPERCITIGCLYSQLHPTISDSIAIVDSELSHHCEFIFFQSLHIGMTPGLAELLKKKKKKPAYKTTPEVFSKLVHNFLHY